MLDITDIQTRMGLMRMAGSLSPAGVAAVKQAAERIKELQQRKAELEAANRPTAKIACSERLISHENPLTWRTRNFDRKWPLPLPKCNLIFRFPIILPGYSRAPAWLRRQGGRRRWTGSTPAAPAPFVSCLHRRGQSLRNLNAAAWPHRATRRSGKGPPFLHFTLRRPGSRQQHFDRAWPSPSPSPGGRSCCEG